MQVPEKVTQSIWKRAGTPQKVFSTLQSSEELSAFFTGLTKGLIYTSNNGVRHYDEHRWQDVKDFAQELLASWKPTFSKYSWGDYCTMRCYKDGFDKWPIEDQVTSHIVCAINEGLRVGRSMGKPWEALIETELLGLCLGAMAAGIRPGPEAKNGWNVSEAGLLLLGEEQERQELVCQAIVLQNHLALILNIHLRREKPEPKVPELSAHAVKIMHAAKCTQLGEYNWAIAIWQTWNPNSSIITGCSSSGIESPDQKTMIVLDKLLRDLRHVERLNLEFS